MRQLPDESTLKGARSALFLFRQPFLLIPGLIGTLVVATLFLAVPGKNGPATLESTLVLLALPPVLGFGLAVPMLFGFMIKRALGPKVPPFEVLEGESLLEERRANHFLGDEGRGGRLFLTDRRVAFVPHRFNIQLARAEQRLADVREVAWARVVTPTGLPVSSFVELAEDARKERYIVADAAALGARIEALATERRAARARPDPDRPRVREDEPSRA